MGYRLEIPKKLNKKIMKFDTSVKKILYSYIKNNLIDTEDPRVYGKALSGNLKGLWRYRIMDYRLIVDIQDDKLIIVAVDFDSRNKIYNKL